MVSLLCNPSRREANIHCQKYMHLHKCDKLSYYPCFSGQTQQTNSPPGYGQTAPFDLGSACSRGACRGSVGGSLYPLPLPGRISRWSVKAAQRQDLYQMKKSSPLISPSTDQHCNLAKGNEDAPEKSPGFTLSSLVHKQRFMVIQQG